MCEDNVETWAGSYEAIGSVTLTFSNVFIRDYLFECILLFGDRDLSK